MKHYMLAIVMTGFTIGPIYADNTTPIDPSVEVDQQIDPPHQNDTNEEEYIQEATLLQIDAICMAPFIFSVLAGFSTFFDVICFS